MAQFTKYSSNDVSAPVLSGTAGSLIALLDAVLINGYGSKTGAGWTKPVATASNISTYKQGAGKQCTMLVNDAGLDVTPTFREASVCGWVSCTGVGTPMGTGNGQFPNPAQLLTSGRVTIRKSSALDSTARPWTVYADNQTMYLFIRATDTLYLGQPYVMTLMFGSIYSYNPADAGNCMISGCSVSSVTPGSVTHGGIDSCAVPGATANAGAYFCDSMGGSTGSVKSYILGDANRMAVLLTAGSSTLQSNIGIAPCPNPADGTLGIIPATIYDGQSAMRGRLRGLYCWAHPIGASSDGAIVQGANDFVGKTFVAIAPMSAGGLMWIETSNTLDTNP